MKIPQEVTRLFNQKLLVKYRFQRHILIKEQHLHSIGMVAAEEHILWVLLSSALEGGEYDVHTWQDPDQTICASL